MSKSNFPPNSAGQRLAPATVGVYDSEPFPNYPIGRGRTPLVTGQSRQDSGLIRVYDAPEDAIYKVNVGWLGDNDLGLKPKAGQSASAVRRPTPQHGDPYDEWELDSQAAGRLLGRLISPGAWAALVIIVLGVLAFVLVTPAFAGAGGAISRYSDVGQVIDAGIAPEPVIDAGTAPAEPVAQSEAPAPVVDGSYTVIGAPSISVSQIEFVLQKYGSPAVGLGQKLLDLGVQYGIDPAYALAFFVHESGCGTQGVARFTKSIGNIRWTAGWDNYSGYRKYPTWEAGMEDWYKLVTDLYINQWGLRTVDAIVPVYAPSGDGNSPSSYIAAVKWMVDDWRGK